MIQAKWLFEHHLQHEALAAFCKEQLKQISLQSMKDDAISSILLSTPPSSIIGKSNGMHASGSPTEYAALHWQEYLNPEQLDKYRQLKSDLSKYQYYIHLFNTIMTSLTPKEAWLIKKIYIEELSLTQIITETNSPYQYYCKSTIHNRKNEILKKANLIISMCPTKGEWET